MNTRILQIYESAIKIYFLFEVLTWFNRCEVDPINRQRSTLQQFSKLDQRRRLDRHASAPTDDAIMISPV